MSNPLQEMPSTSDDDLIRHRLREAMLRPSASGSFAFSQKCSQVRGFIEEQWGITAEIWPKAGLLWLHFDAELTWIDLSRSPSTEIKDWSAIWLWSVSVSCRGDFIACDTSHYMGASFELDELPSSIAIDWTRQIAQACGLTYVDAAPLRRWEVSYDEIDPNFYLDYSPDPPNAFQVIFHE